MTEQKNNGILSPINYHSLEELLLKFFVVILAIFEEQTSVLIFTCADGVKSIVHFLRNGTTRFHSLSELFDMECKISVSDLLSKKSRNTFVLQTLYYQYMPKYIIGRYN